ncbi:uncharacterized protein LOC115227291 [Octopus sinensis]|uniref:Uncharacterized protein LOC115227291 n=1 Tax=Octopus sinensis TaxID=2607531 RepID=A0A6P7TZ63_9MOLL|nr:uncharacterized protein LOC115227291 [Octopus sinensis]
MCKKLNSMTMDDKIRRSGLTTAIPNQIFSTEKKTPKKIDQTIYGEIVLEDIPQAPISPIKSLIAEVPSIYIDHTDSATSESMDLADCKKYDNKQISKEFCDLPTQMVEENESIHINSVSTKSPCTDINSSIDSKQEEEYLLKKEYETINLKLKAMKKIMTMSPHSGKWKFEKDFEKSFLLNLLNTETGKVIFSMIDLFFPTFKGSAKNSQ